MKRYMRVITNFPIFNIPIYWSFKSGVVVASLVINFGFYNIRKILFIKDFYRVSSITDYIYGCLFAGIFQT